MIKRNLNIGDKIGRLTVVSSFEKQVSNKRKRVCWNCICDCGNSCEVLEIALTRKKYTKSCGCYQREKASKRLKQFNSFDLSDKNKCRGTTRCGYDFYFDFEDYDKIKGLCWHRHKDGYLRTCLGKDRFNKNIYMMMHHWVMNIEWKEGFECDHINTKPNDNRKSNLRKVTHQENMQNRGLVSSNKSGYTGVYFCKRSNKWVSYITYKSIKASLGYFKTKEGAVKARKDAEAIYKIVRNEDL